uniref:Uncharacterized protein n=1 Tax=Caenorhabditis japonica TaxID=281687 RepID=A0A8R1I7J4_CAEJA
MCQQDNGNSTPPTLIRATMGCGCGWSAIR